MTQKEKQLLLNDLCARLPYGVKILDIPANVVGYLFLVSTTDTVEYEPVDETNNDTGYQTLYNIKPYLRPMSSMTEEEAKEIQKINWQFCRFKNAECYVGAADDGYCSVSQMADILEYLNKHHFDYRGLIEKGLALEAPEGMYKND